jgi:hypothetical protein
MDKSFPVEDRRIYHPTIGKPTAITGLGGVGPKKSQQQKFGGY